MCVHIIYNVVKGVNRNLLKRPFIIIIIQYSIINRFIKLLYTFIPDNEINVYYLQYIQYTYHIFPGLLKIITNFKQVD